MNLPRWNEYGLLPPVLPEANNVGRQRSPYCFSLLDVVRIFAFSWQRRVLLQGLLDYRKLLHTSGILRGFQWLNGSFIENIETMQKRSPNDIDCVNFIFLPQDTSELDFANYHLNLFDHDNILTHYHIDSYNVVVKNNHPALLIRDTCYWYSIWSHNRYHMWKGFIEVSLENHSDNDAQKLLTSITNGENNV